MDADFGTQLPKYHGWPLSHGHDDYMVDHAFEIWHQSQWLTMVMMTMLLRNGFTVEHGWLYGHDDHGWPCFWEMAPKSTMVDHRHNDHGWPCCHFLNAQSTTVGPWFNHGFLLNFFVSLFSLFFSFPFNPPGSMPVYGDSYLWPSVKFWDTWMLHLSVVNRGGGGSLPLCPVHHAGLQPFKKHSKWSATVSCICSIYSAEDSAGFCISLVTLLAQWQGLVFFFFFFLLLLFLFLFFFFLFCQHGLFSYFFWILTKLSHRDKYLNHYSRTNNDGVKCHDGVTGVKSVNHVKNMRTAPISKLILSHLVDNS